MPFETARVYTVTSSLPWYSISSCTNEGISNSSLSGQRFKGYRCESDMHCYKWKVTWIYEHSPLYRSIDIDKLNPPCAESVQGWDEYRSRRRRKTFSRQRNLQPETQPWFKTVFFLHLETGIKLLTPSPLFHDPWQSIWDFISPTSVYPPLYSNLFIHLYIYISIYLSTYLSSLYLPNSRYLNI